MKKIVLLSALLVSFAATAADVSVNYVRDMNLDRNGLSAEVSAGSFKGVTPFVNVTHVSNAYTRYGVGANYALMQVGPVNVSLNGAGVFQDTSAASNGFGLSLGATASYALSKTVNVNVGVNQFYGQNKIGAFDGAQATVGISTRF